MVADVFRDSTAGLLLNWASNGRILPFPEQRPGYAIPARYLRQQQQQPAATFSSNQSVRTLVPPSGAVAGEKASPSEPPKSLPDISLPAAADVESEVQRQEKADIEASAAATLAESTKDVDLVDWDGDDDPENPQNWPTSKKSFVTLLICIMTFGVYSGSAIYTPGIPGIMAHFDTSLTMATLGLTLFVIGYGIGPLILAPLQSLPIAGRTPGYVVGVFIFTISQIPVIFAPNMGTLLFFRFLAGFVGSPSLSTGGATIQDIWLPQNVPYAIAIWAVGAVLGPVLGPVLGGFPAMNMGADGWRWPIMILSWISAVSFLLLFFLLPETLPSTILLRKAQRLRKLTGNPNLRSQSEIDQENLKMTAVFSEAFIQPFRILFEPVIFVFSLYVGLVYAIFYLFFESFPLIYSEGGVYGWNLGVSQLPFLAFTVTGVITTTAYIYYQKTRIMNLYMTGKFVPEHRLEIGFLTSFSIPLVTLLYGWTARESVHWIVPVIAGALYLPGVFLTFQSVLVYLPTAYPTHAAAVMAANCFLRSTMAGCFPLFGHTFYETLGLGPGSSLLAGLSALMIPIFWYIKRNGANLRARSKYATA